MSWIVKLDRLVDQFCTIATVFVLVAMLVLTITSIVLRWLGHSFLWIDPAVRHGVFIGAFLGGAIATGKGNHIAIDACAKWLEVNGRRHWLRGLQWLTGLVSVGCTLILAYASYEFLLQEREFGADAFLGIHSSVLVAIMPSGFLLVGLRFFLSLFLPHRT